MAKQVIRYLLEGNGSVPTFVEIGGFYPIGEELIGISVDEDKRHLPLSVIRLTLSDLTQRITDIGDSNSEFESAEAEAQALFDRIS